MIKRMKTRTLSLVLAILLFVQNCGFAYAMEEVNNDLYVEEVVDEKTISENSMEATLGATISDNSITEENEDIEETEIEKQEESISENTLEDELKLEEVENKRNGSYYEEGNFIYSSASKTVIQGLKEGVVVTELDIPDGVCTIEVGAFKDNKDIKTVTIPKTVEWIKESAFEGCSGLTEVVFLHDDPTKAIECQNQIFKDCVSLTSVTLPEGLYPIGASFFEGCSSLEKVTLPYNYDIYNSHIQHFGYSIASNAFKGCESLTELTIPSNVTGIGNDVFLNSGINKLNIQMKSIGTDEFVNAGINEGTEVLICNSISEIGYGAFENVPIYKLTISTMDYGKGVKIYGNAFQDCKFLETVEIRCPIYTENVSDGVFSRCSNISKIIFSDGKENYSITNVPQKLFKNTGTSKAVQLILDEPIVTIGESAFEGLNIETISLPATLTTIGKMAFAYCENLTEITIPARVEKIGDQVFLNCNNLSSVIIQATNLQLDSNAKIGKIFENCNLTNISLVSGMTKIPQGLFDGANIQEDTEITIPKTVVHIGANSFKNTPIKQLTLYENVASIGTCAFQDCKKLTNVVVRINNPDVYIGEKIFSGCNLKKIEVHGGVEKIPQYLFSYAGIDDEATIQIPLSVTEIGKSAFESSTLRQIKIPQSVKLVNHNAFRDCINLSKVVIPQTVTEIAETAFDNCPYLKIHTIINSYAYKWAGKKKIATNTKELFAINYVINNGENNMGNPVCYEEGDSCLFFKPSFVEEDYDFKGWYTDSGYKNGFTSLKGKKGNLTLYAKIVPVSYKINYDLGEGTHKGNPLEYNATQNITLKAPTKEGNTFEGWYLKTGDTEERITKIPKGSSGDLDIRAQWRPHEYSIKYVGNGGFTLSDEKEISDGRFYEYDDEYSLMENPFKKEGYEFIGWNTKANGTGISYNDREKVSKLSAKDKSVVMLYAIWESETYYVDYVLNGDDVINNNPDFYNQTKDITLKNPVRTGYTFGGWYPDEACSTKKITKISKNTATDIVLYAKWIENSYKVAFNVNGGKAEPGTLTKHNSIKYTQTIFFPEEETIYRIGYKLVDWNTKKDGTGVSYGISESSGFIEGTEPAKNNGTLTLYAIWEPEATYTIQYHYVGVDGNMVSNPNPTIYTIEKDIKLQAPSYIGYTFLGWYDGDGKKVTSIKKTTKDNIILYGKWSETGNTYTVKFNANGGNSLVSQRTIIYPDKTVIKFPNNVWRDRYKLKEWNTKKDGTGISYGTPTECRFIEETIPAKNKGSLTLYAIWEPEKIHNISYNFGIVDEKKVENKNPGTYDIRNDVTLKNPVAYGYTFKGWYAEPDFVNKVTKIMKDGNGNVALYAKWQVNTYTVKFDANGGNGNVEQQKVSNLQIQLPGNEISKKGYKLIGWNTKKDGTGILYRYEQDNPNKPIALDSQKLTAKDKSTITLYAMWEGIAFNITYEHKDNNGTNLADIKDIRNDNPSTYSIEKDVWLKTPEKIGYTFLGWYTKEGDGDNAVYKRCILVKKNTGDNVTLYGKWKPNTYTVKYNLNRTDITETIKALSCTYDEDIVLQKPTSFADEFIGWSTRRDGEGKIYTGEESVKNLVSKNKGSITLYAKWKGKSE